MEAVNNFTGGLNKDISKSFQNKNTYIDARNVQLITDSGGTNGALINFRGNQSFVTIPDTFAVYKIQASGTGNATLTISGQTASAPLAVTTATTGQNIYDYIDADPNLTDFGTAYKVAIGSNFVIVYSQTENTSPSSSSGNLVVSTPVAAQTNLDIIGYGQIREDIVLFTTNNTSSTGGVGQIWKLTYDKSYIKTSTGNPTITLIYNNDVKFTKQHPIPRLGGTVGRYENSTTQRIYWTDNFNPLRQLNIANVNAMALDPTELEVTTPVSFSVPILQKVEDSGGILNQGMYQCAYRLKNTGGATTIFSEASNWVPIVGPASTTRYVDIIGSYANTGTTKAITWEIPNLDTDFDRIEVATIYRGSEDAIPDINIILDEPVPSSGIFTFTYTGFELNPIPVDLEEYNNYSSVFTHCKSIDSKDNLLFAANLTNNAFTIDFDCKAYRFTSNNVAEANDRSATLTGTGGVTIDGTSPTWPSSTTIDAIQTYATQNLQTAGGHRFQTDGVTLGGEGKNIKYTFTVTHYDLDAKPGTIETTAGSYGFNSRLTNGNAGPITINSTNYPTQNFYNGNKSPYTHDLLKGYQREEMYRFGIVFYDKQGRPGAVNWIADIKMPRVIENDNNYTATTTYVLSDLGGFSGWARAKSLGVEFTINWANLSAADRKKIGGYSIVRVKRTPNDRYIMGSGIIYPTIRDSADSENYLSDNVENIANAYSVGTKASSRYLVTLQSPDFVVGGNSFPGFSSGDILKTAAVCVNGTSASVSAGGSSTLYFNKNYTYTAPASYRQELTMINAAGVVRNAEGTYNIDALNGGGLFNNRTKNGAGAVTDSHTRGNDTVVCEFNNATTNIDYTTPGLTAANANRFYAHYFRNRTSQYGGNTYSARANNEYMFCGHFTRVVDETHFNSNAVITVYGGDVFINVWDNQKGIANWQDNPTGLITSRTTWATTECVVNTDLWHSDSVNKNGLVGLSTGIDFGETLTISDVYQTQKDIRKYYPLPATGASNTEFDNRVAFSQVKINGETTDSWGIFKTNDFYDVEGIYGPINNILVVKDRMLFWQPLAFGHLAINPVSLIEDTTGSEVSTGIGETIQKHDYITNEGGSKHQFGMARGPESIYWFDAIKKKIWKFDSNSLVPISDTKGFHGWINETLKGRVLVTDNPVYQDPTYSTSELGVSATYDFENNKVFFTFFDSTVNLAGDTWTTAKNTLSYNEQFDCFESFHDFYPTIYVNDGHIILTRNPTSASTHKNLFIHNIGNYSSYYGTVYDSTVDMMLNEHPTFTKVFDNLEWQTEVINNTGTNPINIDNLTFNQIRVYNDYQNSDWRTLVVDTDVKRRERTWRMPFPRNRVLYTASASPDIFTDLNSGDKTYGERIRDKYCILNLKFSNSNNRALVFHWLKYLFRASPR